VHYARFLFTRNQRRDFTAFVRPADMTNKEVSVLANAFNYVNDITPLTPARPALYAFPLGSYLYILRHYDSGRTHAGRAIPVIEGIAVRRSDEATLCRRLAEIVARQAELLNVSAIAGDIEQLERQTSEIFEWLPPDDADPPAETAPAEAPDTIEPDTPDLADALAERYPTDWLLLPFSDEGRALLLAALSDERLPLLHVAFGSHAELVSQLRQSGITFDIIGYASANAPEFRPRDARKAVDVRAPSPTETGVSASGPAAPGIPPEPADQANEYNASEQSAEAIPSIYEERKRRQRRRSLLRRLFDALLGR
jgi:hypothetical protein